MLENNSSSTQQAAVARRPLYQGPISKSNSFYQQVSTHFNLEEDRPEHQAFHDFQGQQLTSTSSLVVPPHLPMVFLNQNPPPPPPPLPQAAAETIVATRPILHCRPFQQHQQTSTTTVLHHHHHHHHHFKSSEKHWHNPISTNVPAVVRKELEEEMDNSLIPKLNPLSLINIKQERIESLSQHSLPSQVKLKSKTSAAPSAVVDDYMFVLSKGTPCYWGVNENCYKNHTVIHASSIASTKLLKQTKTSKLLALMNVNTSSSTSNTSTTSTTSSSFSRRNTSTASWSKEEVAFHQALKHHTAGAAGFVENVHVVLPSVVHKRLKGKCISRSKVQMHRKKTAALIKEPDVNNVSSEDAQKFWGHCLIRLGTLIQKPQHKRSRKIYETILTKLQRWENVCVQRNYANDLIDPPTPPSIVPVAIVTPGKNALTN